MRVDSAWSGHASEGNSGHAKIEGMAAELWRDKRQAEKPERIRLKIEKLGKRSTSSPRERNLGERVFSWKREEVLRAGGTNHLRNVGPESRPSDMYCSQMGEVSTEKTEDVGKTTNEEKLEAWVVSERD